MGLPRGSSGCGKFTREIPTGGADFTQMFKICTENEMNDSNGERVPLKGGSFIEVVHKDVRDVPIWGGSAPGTGTSGKGLFIANQAEGWKNMNEAIDKIQAGGKS